MKVATPTVRTALYLLGLTVGSCEVPESPTVQPPQIESGVDLSSIINRNASIEDVVKGSGQGRLYLIGMEHWSGGITKDGVNNDSQQRGTLAYVQADIFHLLEDLSRDGMLDLVIGEGLGPKELTLHPEQKGLSVADWSDYAARMSNPAFAVNFFQTNPRESGYTAFELFDPTALKMYGVDHIKEMEELRQIDRRSFQLAEKYVPTRADFENPQKREQLQKAEVLLEERRRELNDRRSLIYLNEGIQRADELDVGDVAMIIGSSHVPLMVGDYNGERTMYVIKPKSLPGQLLAVK